MNKYITGSYVALEKADGEMENTELIILLTIRNLKKHRLIVEPFSWVHFDLSSTPVNVPPSPNTLGVLLITSEPMGLTAAEGVCVLTLYCPCRGPVQEGGAGGRPQPPAPDPRGARGPRHPRLKRSEMATVFHATAVRGAFDDSLATHL